MQLELFSEGTSWASSIREESGPPLSIAVEPAIAPQPLVRRGMVRVRSEVLSVLSAARIDGRELTLTAELARDLYDEVNTVLTALGASYVPRRRCHRFEQSAAPVIAEVLRTGHAPRVNRYDYFPTPDALADTVAAFAESAIGWGAATDGRRLLEPSAGRGQLVDAACRLDPAARDHFVLVEADSVQAEHLRSAGHGAVHEADFLSWQCTETFLGILMNPPFRDEAKKDIFEAHVRKAYSLLHPEGSMVVVLPQGVLFNSRWRAFRSWLGERCENYELAEPSAFAASGTSIATFVVALVGTAAAARMNTADPGALSAQEFRLWAALNNDSASYSQALAVARSDEPTRRAFLHQLADKAARDGSGLLSLEEPYITELCAYLAGLTE